ADADGTTTSVFSFQWQSSTNGTTWTNIGGATSASFTPGALQVGLMLRVVASFTDDQGFLNQVASAATAFIGGTFNGGPGNDILTGTAGDDVMNGGGGNDTLNGGAGNDLIDGATGADSMTGGAGNDTFYVDNVLDSVTEAAGDGRDMVRTTLASYSLGANVEDLAYIGSSNFTAVGNGLANVIAGAVGNDTLSGGGGNDMMFGVAGNDVLNGNAGADRMVGGVGDDTFYVDNALDVVVENTGEGSDMVRTTLSSYTLGANLEVLVSLGAGAFTGTGNALANRLVGGTSTDTLDGLAGNDILHGLTGNDVLNGGADADTMMGGSGNDTYYVDNALDFVAEAVGDGTDVVRTTLSSYSLGTNVENLVFIGSGAFSGTGNTLANRILGGSDADTLNGLGGNDVLVGGAGNDTMNGGAGNDIFQFGAGFGQDQILGFDAIPAGGQDRLHVANLGITAANFAGSVVIAGVGADTLVTIGADSITLVGVASATVTQADFIVS
ncbi:calcium-binding protein, partial [Pseudomonas sp. JG-B]|uniref:calcium-binding protein n=1 Tax=Pseudomonas sp. JG-B TaxID=2603214 RepID=UPI0015B5AF39